MAAQTRIDTGDAAPRWTSQQRMGLSMVYIYGACGLLVGMQRGIEIVGGVVVRVGPLAVCDGLQTSAHEPENAESQNADEREGRDGFLHRRDSAAHYRQEIAGVHGHAQRVDAGRACNRNGSCSARDRSHSYKQPEEGSIGRLASLFAPCKKLNKHRRFEAGLQVTDVMSLGPQTSVRLGQSARIRLAMARLLPASGLHKSKAVVELQSATIVFRANGR